MTTGSVMLHRMMLSSGMHCQQSTAHRHKGEQLTTLAAASEDDITEETLLMSATFDCITTTPLPVLPGSELFKTVNVT